MGWCKNPATKFACDDALERQLTNAGLPVQQGLRLVLTQAAFKPTGEYNTALCEFDTKPTADKTFANFCPFIINEYAKCTKARNTAKSVGFHVANVARKATLMEEAAEQSLAYAAIANVLKEGQNEQMEKMMNMLNKVLQKLPGTQGTGNGQGNGTGNCQQNPKCPHCKFHHAKPANECWELEANATMHLANRKPATKSRKNTSNANRSS